MIDRESQKKYQVSCEDWARIEALRLAPVEDNDAKHCLRCGTAARDESRTILSMGRRGAAPVLISHYCHSPMKYSSGSCSERGAGTGEISLKMEEP